MRASAIIGKTIKAVRQTVEYNIQIGALDPCIEEIEFTDGTLLRFVVSEWENGYGVNGIVVKRPASRRPE